MMAACQPKRAGLARLVALSVWATLVVSITDAFVPPKPVSRRKTPQLFMGGLTLYGSPGSRYVLGKNNKNHNNPSNERALSKHTDHPW